jgi:hypothetical protein
LREGDIHIFLTRAPIDYLLIMEITIQTEVHHEHTLIGQTDVHDPAGNPGVGGIEPYIFYHQVRITGPAACPCIFDIMYEE